MKKTTVALVMCCTIATAAFAQGGAQNAPQGRQNRPRPAFAPAAVAEMLDAYALMQSEKQLQLDEAQFGDFVGRLKNLQRLRRRNQHARGVILRDLNRLTAAADRDEAAIRDRMKALKDHDDRAAAELRKAYDAVDEGLSPWQQARFRLVEENIERRKLDLLLRARQRAATQPR